MLQSSNALLDDGLSLAADRIPGTGGTQRPVAPAIGRGDEGCAPRT
jgi:hypothetical protein